MWLNFWVLGSKIVGGIPDTPPPHQNDIVHYSKIHIDRLHFEVFRTPDNESHYQYYNGRHP